MSVNAIEIKNLNFSYDNEGQILEGVNISIEEGKFYTIMGPNGSGKTTLIKLLSKALNSENKKIFIGNKDINNINNRSLARKVAVVPQSTSIEFDFSVQDIVLMGRAPYLSRFSSESDEDLKISRAAMEITDTWNLRNKSINALSGGELQRVIVARAIAQETDIVLLDEPISNLDIHHQVEILNQIRELNKKRKKTIIAVLHDLNLATAYSDYMILMHGGRVHTIGTPGEILNRNVIKEVYGLDVNIVYDPATNRPFVIPLI